MRMNNFMSKVTRFNRLPLRRLETEALVVIIGFS
jgi:hypothetical protein